MKNLRNGAGLQGLDRAREPRISNTDAEPDPSEPVKEAYDRARFPDDFYTGLIVMLDRVRGRGVVRSSSGREIRFEFPFITVVGAELGGKAPGIELLHQGDTVGFDMGWTSRGLRVTKIKPVHERRE
jgi:hypothetical protein